MPSPEKLTPEDAFADPTARRHRATLVFDDKAEESELAVHADSLDNTAIDLRHEKDQLIALVSASLVTKEVFDAGLTSLTPLSRLEGGEISATMRVAALVHTISVYDGEFVLKLALYVRRELNIRNTANFLVAMCAFEPICQPFLGCYMMQIVRLPTDWLTIANMAHKMQDVYLLFCLDIDSSVPESPKETQPEQTLQRQCRRSLLTKQQRRRGLPNALRLALVATFSIFSEFALAKHNKERSMKRKRAIKKKETSTIEEFSMKELIRRLHISSRPYVICCLLGKRYPDTEEDFKLLGLDEGGRRQFEPSMCSRRMRLPVPETWETQLAARGNNGKVWDELVKNRKLPFMAALRNVRNLLLQDCQPETHEEVIRFLSSPDEVAASMQFPYRFLSAYDSIFPLSKTSSDASDICSSTTKGKCLHEVRKKYLDALETAAEISTRLNIPPIPGTSLVLWNVRSTPMQGTVDGPTGLNAAAMIGAAFKYACEHCTLILFCGNVWIEADWDFRREGGMLCNVRRLIEECREINNDSNTDGFPYNYLNTVVERRVALSSLVVMDDKHSTYSGLNTDAPSLGDMPIYLDRLRRTCNEDLLFVALSMSSTAPFTNPNQSGGKPAHESYRHKHDLLLTGFTDVVIRVVAERASGGPRHYIERADEVYHVNRGLARLEALTSASALQALRQVVQIEKEHRVCTAGNAHTHGTSSFNGNAEEGELTTEEGLSFAGQMSLGTCSMNSATGKTDSNIGLKPSSKRLLSTYRDCRFFLSSTFLDMNNERNALVLDVFPRLRRWVVEEGLRVNIIDVDLRWGITEEATSANLSVSVCLNEVSRCAPFFLGMLGSRYGYAPPTLYHQVDEDVDPSDFGWLRALPEGNEDALSVTEMEMRHAIYNAERRTGRSNPITMAFFVRDHDALVQSLPANQKNAFAPDKPTTMKAIGKLVEYVHSKGAPTIPYTATYLREVDPHKIGSSMGMFSEQQVTPFSMNSFSSLLSSSSSTSKTVMVPLEMLDFSRKALVALKAIIRRHFGLEEIDDDNETDLSINSSHGVALPKTVPPLQEETTWTRKDEAKMTKYNASSTENEGTLYVKEYMNQSNFTSTLLNTFVPPMGVVEKLVLFALTGQAPPDGKDASALTNEASFLSSCSVPTSSVNPTTPLQTHLTFSLEPTNIVAVPEEEIKKKPIKPFISDEEEFNAHGSGDDGDVVELASAAQRNVLLLEGAEGNGKSTVAAAVAAHISQLEESGVVVVHFASQASDGTLRRLAYYLAFSLVYRLGLQEYFRISEGDSAVTLLQLLPHIYAAARKRGSVCVILDGLEKSAHAAETLSTLGWLVPPGTAPEIRFILAVTTNCSFAAALNSRVPPAWVMMLPELSPTERAELVRRHLASYGKRLQESFRLNEMSLLLRKRDASQAAYLTLAISYLRLFSAFDTLRADMLQLPQTLAQLHVEVYRQLENKFGVNTCRSVLVVLYLSSEMGGIKEFNLYRLVGNVASASRLVTLLSGTCLRVTRGRVAVSNAAFEASIASRYLSRSTDIADACANILAAELHFSPLTFDDNRQAARNRILSAMEAMKNDTGDEGVFRPSRYPARQLLAILDLAVRARQHDALATLASYLPLLENLLVNATYLQRFTNVLSQAVLTNTLLARRLGPILSLLERSYHILSDRPQMLLQVVRNLRAETFFHGEKRCKSGERWVNWLNRTQHGGEGCVKVPFPSTEPLLCLVISDDGRMMAGGSGDFVARVLPLGARDQITSALSHDAPVTAVAFVPRRTHILVTGCEHGVIRVWSLEDNSLLQQGRMHRRRITALSFHPTEEGVLCSSSHDGTCAFWRVASSLTSAAIAREAKSRLKPTEIWRHHRAPVSSVVYHSSGDILATGSWEGIVYFVNVSRRIETSMTSTHLSIKTGTIIEDVVPCENHVFETGSPVRSLAFTPSMVVTCAVGLFNGDICLYDYVSATCNARLSTHASVPITCVAFSPDAKLMASANARGGVCLAYAGVAGTFAGALNGHCETVAAIAFHPQRPATLFTASHDRSLKEWGLDLSGGAAWRGVHLACVTACAAALDGSFFVTSGADGVAIVFTRQERSGGVAADETESLFVPYFILPHERHRVTCIDIGMENRRILCGTAIGEVFVWTSTPGLNRREGRLLHRVRVTGINPIVSITCDVNDNGWATAIAADGAIAAWDLNTKDVQIKAQGSSLSWVPAPKHSIITSTRASPRPQVIVTTTPSTRAKTITKTTTSMTTKTTLLDSAMREEPKTYGEEIIAAIALTSESAPPGKLLAGQYIAIGPHRCFLVSALHSGAVVLRPTRSSRRVETFLCASRGVRFQTWDSAVEARVLFALGTNLGEVILVEAVCTPKSAETDATAQHSHAVQTESHTRVEDCTGDVIAMMHDLYTRVLLESRQRISIVHRGGRAFPVEAVALCPIPITVTAEATLTPSNLPWRDASTALRLIVSGRDGSMRLFNVFPFREILPGAEAEADGPMYVECGAFFPSSPATTVSFLRTTCMWIAGDMLGNVYQLQLTHEVDKHLSDKQKRHRETVLETIRGPFRWPEMFAKDVSVLEVSAKGTREDKSEWRNEQRRITALFGCPNASDAAHMMIHPETLDVSAACPAGVDHPIPSRGNPLNHSSTLHTDCYAGVPPYEMILQKAPPANLVDAADRRAWLLKRQQLLVEALQAQRNATKAREVLAAYSREALLSLGVSLEKE